MTYRPTITALAVLAIALPMTAFGDATGTPTLSANSDFNFDNSTTVSSGGDIKFTGSSITLVGTATIFNEGAIGSASYAALSQTLLQGFGAAGLFTQTPLSGSTLVVNDVFGIHTNGGNYAKVLITAVSSSSITFQYDTFGGTGGTPTPSITAVLDAGSYTPSIAQGSIFVVKGSLLSASGFVQTSFPLPTTTGGVTIGFTPLTGGSPTNAYIIYLYNQSGVNQLAAVLPSSVAPGTYNVTVSYNGSTTAGFPVQVVAKKPGFITADSTGNGLVVAQNYVSASELDVARFTTGSIGGYTVSPAHPGQVIILWMTGLGGVTGGDNVASPGYNFEANGGNITVTIGGTPITPAYAGRAPGLAGTDQVNLTLPANIATGCTVPVQLSENGSVSQTTFISIAPTAGANACVQAGYTTSQLQQFDNGTLTILGGGMGMTSISGSIPGLGTFSQGIVSGGFLKYTGFELAAIPAGTGGNVTTTQGCTVTQFPTPQGNIFIGGVGIGLDAGQITLNGPAGSGFNNVALAETADTYSLTFAGANATISGKMVAGAYTLNGAGGADIGKFSTTLNLATPLTVTGSLPTTINRSAGVTVNWTGGNSSDIVVVSGSALNFVNGVTTGAVFACLTTAGAGGLTVGSSVLNQLPAVSSAASSAGTGATAFTVGWAVTNGTGTFTAPLTAGGTLNGTFTASVSTTTVPTYQ
jgi:uncharacterized protein (TIGR03437 family)